MNILGNIIWFIFGGLVSCLTWFFIGVLYSITIIGIPIGVQCFKLGIFSLFPFGKEVVYATNTSSTIFNIIWIIFGGLFLALEYFLLGVLYCILIITIPFGLQCFKLSKLALMPFGATFISTNK
ncbi:MAG: YccF domain-containing protein [Bacilli bacterium]